MTRLRYRLSVVVASAAVMAVVTVPAGPAAAGGATWYFDQESYAPGETASAVAGIFWGYRPEFGTPEDGPYLAYAYEASAWEALTMTNDTWPRIPAGATFLGVIETGEGPIEQEPGFLVGPNHARLVFEVPALPAATYELLHCNDPCTKTLADITWGQFTVREGAPPASTPTPSKPPRAYAAASPGRSAQQGSSAGARAPANDRVSTTAEPPGATTPRNRVDDRGASGAAATIAGAGVALAAAGTLAVTRSRRRRQTPTT